MELKKNAHADLEKKRPLFFQIGLIVSLALTLIVLEWKSYEGKGTDLGLLVIDQTEEEMIPVTQHEPPPPPPPPAPVVELQLVENDKVLEDEVEILETEADQSTLVQVIQHEEVIAEPEIFTIVEEMPSFPGCEKILNLEKRKACTDEKIYELLLKNTKYPPMAKDAGIQGTVYVGFVIGTDGKAQNVSIARGIKGLDEEAIRVIHTFPAFNPGKQRGKAVNVHYYIPITFTLR